MEYRHKVERSRSEEENENKSDASGVETNSGIMMRESKDLNLDCQHGSGADIEPVY